MIATNIQDKIQRQREGGKKLGIILQKLLDMANVGISLVDIEEEAQRLIKAAGGTPSFQTVEGYRWATCLCINDEVVHGVPRGYVLQDGDLLTIDVGMLYKGYHTDTAWTKIVTYSDFTLDTFKYRDLSSFLHVGEQALFRAIKQAKAGNRIGHISQVIQTTVENAGFHVITALVGHTVGKELHEKPQIPGYLRGSIEKTPVLVNGMTIAIEVIYSMGSSHIVYANDDGWTLATSDGSLSAVFEHTILVSEHYPEVLTESRV